MYIKRSGYIMATKKKSSKKAKAGKKGGKS
jgi:hypothetical protein